MPVVWSLWPYVGAGTATDPYRVEFAPLTIAGRARIVTAGLTCFDPVTGQLREEPSDAFNGAVAALNSCQQIAPVGGGFMLVRVDPGEHVGFNLALEALRGLNLFDEDIDSLVDRARAERDAAESTLASVLPTFDPEPDPIVAAVDVIDNVDVLPNGIEVRTYYSAVINPEVPTPSYELPNATEVMDTILTESTTDPNTAIGRADTAWHLATCVIAANELPDIVTGL